MTPTAFADLVMDPALVLMERWTGVVSGNQARVLLLAIAGQESAWEHRRQIGGPARGFYQFEKGGGCRGVMTHAASKHHALQICTVMNIPTDETSVFEALAWSDILATGFARLLLLTDAAALPPVGAVSAAWDYYLRNWRPGKPHPDVWPANYDAAVEAAAIPMS